MGIQMEAEMAGILYYLFFQGIGICLVFLFCKKALPDTDFFSRMLFGSCTGSLLFTWLPVLFSFLFDFTPAAHISALFAAICLPVFFRFLFKTPDRLLPASRPHIHFSFFLCFAIFMGLVSYLLYTHTLLPGTDNGLYTGQCTYGDMNMHLGFITSLAVTHTFPPEYSIFPGTRLSYPFLCDSCSSSLLLLGCSLRISYIFPMLFAMGQLFCIVYLAAAKFTGSHAKGLLTLTFFFLNGGLGFIYFLPFLKTARYSFADIFTGFYTTPTNLTDQNIRWVNLIADMLLPQRATLFGYAVLFPALYLLYQAAFCQKRCLFLPAGLFVSALPMIHTHSFFSAGIISACWLLLRLYRTAKADFPLRAPFLLVCFFGFFSVLHLIHAKSPLSSKVLMGIGLSLPVLLFLYGIFLLIRTLKKTRQSLPDSFFLYLLCVLLLALPQLLYWTFGQVSEGGFVRGHFNWGNQKDTYLWFYLKNMGIVLLLIIGATFTCKKKTIRLLLPASLLFWTGELIVFTPNTYDNNKILYVAYFLLCIAAADYWGNCYNNLKNRALKNILAAISLFLAVFSAVLTLGREVVSRYQLYSPAQTALAAYIAENTPTDAVFLTDTRHNNEVSSLTGRTIVCGTDTFLYYHGLDTSLRQKEVQQMYENPLQSAALFEKYNVSYIVVSPYERNSYQLAEETFRNHFEEIFSFEDFSGQTVLYRFSPD